MKSMMRLGLLILLFSLLLVGCKTALPPDSGTADTTATTETTSPTPTGLEIVKDGTAYYRIVRGENAPQEMIDAALQVRTMISGATDVLPDIATDWVKKGTEHDHTSLEILIGTTDYAESAKAMEGIGYGDYIIARVDNKIVINARTTEGLNEACSAFRKLIREHTKTKNFILPADLWLTGTGNKLVNLLPLYDNGTLSSIYNAGGETQLLVFEDTTVEAYTAYLQKLTDAGYALYAENEITDNRFSTYTNETHVINAGYYAYANEMRITIEPQSALPPRASDNTYEKKIQPSVGQLGVAFPGSDGDIVNNGQSQILQLSDGSYVVIDGGCKRDVEAKMLYEYMYEYAPDPNNITIAAWIFTHGHGDHTGGYETFTKNYASKVKLELLIGNFPDRALLADGEAPSGDRIPDSTTSYPGSKWIQAHVGQVFYLRDAKIEILYTLESYAPKALDYYNTSSIIFTVELGGQTLLMLGDASQDACKITYQMYGNALKSDFIQVAHHGFGTGSSVYTGVTSVYTAAAAPVILWPCSDYAYTTMTSRAHSKHLIDLAATKEIFVAGTRVIRLPLPYTVGTSTFESILK